MTIDEIKNLSSEQIYKMKRKDLEQALRIANRNAKSIRNELVEQTRANPTLPKPQILRQQGSIDWETYSFNISKSDRLPQLRKKLNSVVGFLNSKSIHYENWSKELNRFTNDIIKKATQQRDAKGRFLSKPKLTGEFYDRFWKVYDKISNNANIRTAFSQGSPQFQVYLYEQMTQYQGMSVEDIAMEILNNFDERYEQEQARIRKSERTPKYSSGFGRKGI